MKFILSNGHLNAIKITIKKKDWLHFKNTINFFFSVSRKQYNEVNTQW